MRLTPDQHRTIRAAAAAAFGPGVRVRLFGSRLDDRRRGGDYDLYVETPIADPERLVAARLEFLKRLHAEPCFEEERIDVVLHSPLHREPRPIDEAAAAGVEL